MKIKKGDQVTILSGKDKGKKGPITKVLPEKGRVVVDGVNMVKKHRRSKKQGEKGQRINMPVSINASNVQIICSRCGKPTRIGYKLVEDKKVRICKKCNQEI